MFQICWQKKILFYILDSNATDDKSTDETEEFEEAYVCEYCDETFPQAYELIEHRETHAEAHDKQSDSE